MPFVQHVRRPLADSLACQLHVLHRLHSAPRPEAQGCQICASFSADAHQLSVSQPLNLGKSHAFLATGPLMEQQRSLLHATRGLLRTTASEVAHIAIAPVRAGQSALFGSSAHDPGPGSEPPSPRAVSRGVRTTLARPLEVQARFPVGIVLPVGPGDPPCLGLRPIWVLYPLSGVTEASIFQSEEDCSL